MKERRKTCTSSSGKSISLSSTFDPLEFSLPGMKHTPNYSKQFTQNEKRKKQKKQNRIEKSRREAKAVRAAPGATEEEMESRGGKEEEGRGRRQQPNRGREKAAPRREAMALWHDTCWRDLGGRRNPINILI